tara:strand:+ start:2278 stop:2529 length:252 start_codon:yes stop_codon:yes gene_type:complete
MVYTRKWEDMIDFVERYKVELSGGWIWEVKIKYKQGMENLIAKFPFDDRIPEEKEEARKLAQMHANDLQNATNKLKAKLKING